MKIHKEDKVELHLLVKEAYEGLVSLESHLSFARDNATGLSSTLSELRDSSVLLLNEDAYSSEYLSEIKVMMDDIMLESVSLRNQVKNIKAGFHQHFTDHYHLKLR